MLLPHSNLAVGVLALAGLTALAGCDGTTDPIQQPPDTTITFPTIMPLFAVTQNVEVTDLGTLGGTGVHVAQGVNELGHIAGTSTDGVGNLRAFYWTPEGGMVDLGTTGGDSSWGGDINEQDMIVGRSQNASGITEAFTWTPTGGMQGLGTFGGLFSAAFGVNNGEWVVGWYIPVGRGVQSFLWHATGGYQELPTLGSLIFGYANEINDAGMVVGLSRAADTVGDPTMSYYWTAGTGTQSLGSLGADFSEHDAFRINAFGQVSGGAFNETTGMWHPFVWHADSGLTDLRTLGFDADRSGLAFGINLLGHTAVLIIKSDSTRTPSVWVPGTGLVELPTLGGQDGEIWGINDLGMIVGWSETAGGAMRPAKWQLVFAGVERVEDATAVLQAITDTSTGEARDKLADVVDRAQDALVAFRDDPPDNVGALGDLAGVVDKLADAVQNGWIDPEIGNHLLEVYTQAARDVAAAAIQAAIDRGGDPGKIASAEQDLADGDALRELGDFKSAVAKYKSATNDAEGA